MPAAPDTTKSDAGEHDAPNGRADETERPAHANPESPWAPLHVPLFRAFWGASLVSNLGTWIHEVGAGWLMTSLDASPEMVSAVRISLSLPMMLLAIPAGVLADRVDRRKLLIATQAVLCLITASLSLLTGTGLISSWLLLALTFAIGLGTVLHVLTWQSTIPTLVPREQLTRAIALGSVSFNLARSVGPALGGILIALAGAWIAFSINALSFAVVLIVLLRWKRTATESSRGLSYRDSLLEGFGFVSSHATMRHVFASVLLFLGPATALWSLLPLVARQQLGWDSKGFGLLVTTLGIGAVVAARILHSFHRRFGKDVTITLAMLTFASGLYLLSVADSGATAFAACFVMGATWMMTLTTLNATAQMTLPDELRARGMGCYLTVMSLGMAAGAIVWGQVAGAYGLQSTQSIAAATMIAAAAFRLLFRVQTT